MAIDDAIMLIVGFWISRAISIGQYVDWNRHRAWEYYPAYRYVSQNAFPLDFAYLILALAVWVVPARVLSAGDVEALKPYQVGATILILIAAVATFQALLEHIRKPPPTAD